MADRKELTLNNETQRSMKKEKKRKERGVFKEE